jgi:TonB-dependent receptor
LTCSFAFLNEKNQNMRIFYSTLILCLLVSTALVAQSGIRGKILDGQSEQMPGAHVYLEGTDYSGFTDINGEYAIFNVPDGEYNLVVSYIGYEDQKESVSIEDGKTLYKDVILNEGVLLTEIVINGRLEGQAKALNTQKNNLNITEIIAREQMERFPDANIGDALKRISGINVQYDQGEARFANIRGTAPELNSITINGERIPSAEAEQRYVQLDLIPADVIETVELSKAVTPDMDGDAIGGAINLVTQKALPNSQFKGTIGSGYSFLTAKPVYKGKLSYSNRFFNNKLGLIVNASILDKYVRSDNVETEWDYADENNKDGSAIPTEIQIRQYELQRLRQSYSATLDYKINKNHSIYFTGMYNWRNDWENRFRTVFTDIEEDDNGQLITEIRRETKGGTSDNKSARLEDQRMQSFGGGGEHFFNNVKVNWTLTALKASEERPNERYVSLRVKETPVSLNLDDLRAPKITPLDGEVADISQAYSLREITEEYQYTEEKDLNGRLDIEFPIISGKNSSKMKFGARYKSKSKFRDNTFSEYAPIDEDAFIADALKNTESKTYENFNAGDYEVGSFVSETYLGEIDLQNGFEGEEVLEELAGNFNAEENVLAGYLMYTQNFGDKLSLIGGVRFERTAVDYAGKIFDGEELKDTENEADDYSNFMPGLHLKFSPSQWTNFRLAWTNTIARPNYFDLVPYQEIVTEDNEISVGNPSLIATTAMNFDLLVEHYFKNIGIISGGVFYKNLTNVIADKTSIDFTYQGNTYDRFSQPVNTGNADMLGFEVGLQRRLDFLPSFLSNLTVYANYTYTNSKLKDITLEGREDETLPLVGTPQNIINASLAYDTKKLDVRVSFNFADAFIEEYDDEAFFDRWYDSVTFLDVNVDYQINKTWKAYLSLNNLLNQPLRYYQGVTDRNMQMEFYGIQAKAGLKFKFNK